MSIWKWFSGKSKLGVPSAGLRQFRTDVQDRGDTYALSGRWIEELFPGKTSVEVMKRGDIKDFFNSTDRKFEWTVTYMHHPDPDVLAQALEATAPFSQLATVENFAYLVTHGDRKIEEVALSFFWRAVGEGSFTTFFNILGSGGMISSDVDPARAKAAAKVLYAKCPADCPSANKRKFKELATQHRLL